MSKSFVVAAKQYFGQKPDQTLRQFADELKELTAKDKEELSVLLSKELGEEVKVQV